MSIITAKIVDVLRPAVATMQTVFSDVFTVWDDQTFPFAGREIDRVLGRLSHDFVNGGIVFPDDSRDTEVDTIPMIHQLRHSWKIASNIWPHIHWYPVSDPYVSVPNFGLRYKINPNNGQPSVWYEVAINGIEPPEDMGYEWTAGDLVVSKFPEIDMSNYTGDTTLSTIIDYHFFRDVANASGLFDGAESSPVDVTMKTFDVHIEKDALGSFLQWAKFGR